ncbi:sigma-54 interaction domain-containing protein [Youngiibacter multivorans]|uniref:HTH-type transcriptional regulatory protein TyrR n=1 Tax=Youngiibacter multivorans TaxID=937251 RepID=A0ABS4G2N4_9CLOT|nr:sigma 54-interacting transcriptional regulator [Youngiibacter multivorans]MBP1918808.1 PAS domain S-box-containing protein [Youngiibacter multivorans]
MYDDNLINIRTDDSWAYIEVDGQGRITDFNDKSVSYFKYIKNGDILTDVLPWFSASWLRDNIDKRIAKTSFEDRFLLQFIKKEKDNVKVLLNDIFEFKDVMQAWCEIGESLIKLQSFIDCYDDSVMITNGKGIIRAFNQNFKRVSGLENVEIMNRSIYELEAEGLFPYCSIMEVIKSGEERDSVVRFSNGTEVIMTSKPLFHDGRMIRITSNIRNVNELNRRYEELSENRVRNKKKYITKLKLNEAVEKLNIGLYSSEKMESVMEVIETVADYDLPLLLTGESGTGKSMIAKCIFLSKSSCRGSFVHINCSAIPENLIESELFGFEKGSFTGADKPKKGLFEEAKDGVIFLDEIGDMPVQLQAKLLNVLQEKKFYRVGGTKPIETNAQVIAATNRNLKDLVSKGLFREDLYFRLNVIPIEIPALRERKEDIPILAKNMVDELNATYGCKKIIDGEAMNLLKEYEWPGNIRELRNLIERLILLSKHSLITVKDLPEELTSAASKKPLLGNNTSNKGDIFDSGRSLKDIMSEVEAEIIEHAIEKYGSIRKAAAELSVNESTITRKKKRSKVN